MTNSTSWSAYGLAGAGHAEDKAVGVEQLPAVGEDEVLADGILAVVHAALMEDLLGLERHEDGQRLGGKGAEGIDAAQAQGPVSYTHLGFIVEVSEEVYTLSAVGGALTGTLDLSYLPEGEYRPIMYSSDRCV